MVEFAVVVYSFKVTFGVTEINLESVFLGKFSVCTGVNVMFIESPIPSVAFADVTMCLVRLNDAFHISLSHKLTISAIWLGVLVGISNSSASLTIPSMNMLISLVL